MVASFYEIWVNDKGLFKTAYGFIIAIHGDHDPQPAEGVQRPLSRIIKDFRFILLEKCGHKPWVERSARDRFYTILKSEIEE